MLNRNAVVLVALVIGLTGGSVASATGLVNGRTIVNHTITIDKLTKPAVKSLTGKRGARGAPGAQGLQGIPGAAGATGAAGSNGTVSGVVVWTGSYGGAGGGNGVGTTMTASASCGDDISTYGKTLIGGGGTVTSNGTARGALTASWPSTPTVSGLPYNQINGTWTVSGIITATGTGTVTAQAYAICA